MEHTLAIFFIILGAVLAAGLPGMGEGALMDGSDCMGST